MKRAFAAISPLLFALTAHAAVLRITVNDMIHPISDEYIGRALSEAARAHDSAVVIDLSTPGGLLDSTRSIVEKLMTSPVPVIVYVAPAGTRAASAGFFLLEAADVAAMAPGTNTGAASPVLMGQQLDPVMRNKIENDASAWLRSIVSKRGRNADLAEKTIREAKAFPEKEALEEHLIDLVAPDEPQLLAMLEGRAVTRFDGRTEMLHTAGAEVAEYRRSARESIIDSVADPN